MSDEQVKFYLDHGYLVVPDLIPMNEIEELREDTVLIARGGYPSECIGSLPITYE